MLPWALSLSGGYKNPAGGCRTCHFPGHQCLTPGKRWSLGQLPRAHGWGLWSAQLQEQLEEHPRSRARPLLGTGSCGGGLGVGGLGAVPGCGRMLMLMWAQSCLCSTPCSALPSLPAPAASTGALAQGAASGRRSFPGHGQGCLPGPGAHWARCPLLHMALVAALTGKGELFIHFSTEQPLCCPPHCW